MVTSAQAAASLIAARVPAGSAVLVAGAIGLRLALRARGLRPVSVAADRPVAVVQGYAPDLSYGLLAEAMMAVRDGALFVAANTDATLPSPRGLQPGNGSLVQVITNATGVKPVVAGKPEPPLHREAVTRTGARRPLVVGDRLDTDIEGAVNGGADSAVRPHRRQHAADLVLAPPGAAAYLHRRRPRRPARAAAGRRSRRGASRQVELRRLDGVPRLPSGPVELAGDGDPVDGLRALCAVAWSALSRAPTQAELADLRTRLKISLKS